MPRRGPGRRAGEPFVPGDLPPVRPGRAHWSSGCSSSSSRSRRRGRSRSFGAIGARSRTLIWALMVQVLVVAGARRRDRHLPLPPVLACGSDPSAAIRRPDRRRDWASLILMLGVASRCSGVGGSPDRTGRGTLGWRSGDMRLALREMRRQPSRFVTAVVLLDPHRNAAHAARWAPGRSDPARRPERSRRSAPTS